MDDTEQIFEIKDLTASSNWENFILNLQEILIQWNLGRNKEIDYDINDSTAKTGLEQVPSNHNEHSNLNLPRLLSNPKLWNKKQELIHFGKVSFSFACFTFLDKKKKPNASGHIKDSENASNAICTPFSSNSSWLDMNSIENDWSSYGHPLVRYYGLTQFLVLCPIKAETIDTEDRARHLLGSAVLALENISCEVPFFCQISNLNRNLFMGVSLISGGYRTYYDMIQYPEVPQSYQYMSELIVLFKKKLYSSLSYSSAFRSKSYLDEQSNMSSSAKFKVSVRFSYLLNKWPTQYLLFEENISDIQSNSWIEEQFSYFNSNFETNHLFFKLVNNWGFNSCLYMDPIEKLELSTIWPSVAEELIVDNAYHSDLQLRNVPRWSLSASFFVSSKSNLKLCPLTEYFKLFTSLSDQYKSLVLLNYVDQTEDNSINARTALDRLTSKSESIITYTTTQLISQLKQNFTINSDNLTFAMESCHTLIDFMFEPSDEETHCSTSENIDFGAEFGSFNLQSFKSASVNSLGWRIAHLLANLYNRTKKVKIFAKLWKLFLNRLRHHWQTSTLLPHLSGQHNSIDLGNCLFVQKLEMLNSCIFRKIQLECNIYNDAPDKDVDEEEEDEFFDANNSLDEETDSEETISKAEGQSKVLMDNEQRPMCLLHKPSQPIYIPVTQDPSPMTEDMLSQQGALLTNLPKGNCDNPTITSFTLGLLSDMEAFKAANPEAQFEDFIRWHSPRDWVEIKSKNNDSDGKTQFGLSSRMRDSSTWIKIWNMAKACSVKKQKRLFNYTKEAEEILHNFEVATLDQVVEWLTPILAKGIVGQILNYRFEVLQFVKQKQIQSAPDNSIEMKQLLSMLSIDLNVLQFCFMEKNFCKFAHHLFIIENQLLRFYSLIKKFAFVSECEYKKLFKELLDSSETAQNPKQQSSQTSRSLGGRKLCVTSNINDRKFSPTELVRFIVRLMNEQDVEFSGSSFFSKLIIRMFMDSGRFQYEQTTSVGDRIAAIDLDNNRENNANQSSLINKFLKPREKEFIFRAVSLPRPAPYSRPSSHRMYCLLKEGSDFRIASAVTEDSYYF